MVLVLASFYFYAIIAVVAMHLFVSLLPNTPGLSLSTQMVKADGAKLQPRSA